MAVDEAIDRLLDQPALVKLVEWYFDPSSPFAGHSFDSVGDNPPDRFTVGDLLAVSLLDEPFRPLAVRSLLDDDRWSPLLAVVPTDVDLWRIDETQYEAADRLWQAVRELGYVGPTRAGKLLARKRPALVPIYDSVVGSYLGSFDGFWWELHSALQDDDRRNRIAVLGAGLQPQPTILRTLDVAVWMRHARARTAIAARKDTGITD